MVADVSRLIVALKFAQCEGPLSEAMAQRIFVLKR
jgi:hypothetical protein